MITYFTSRDGERRVVHAPLAKFLIWTFLILMLVLTLPLAFVLWLFGFEGFFRDRSWTIDKQAFKRKAKA